MEKKQKQEKEVNAFGLTKEQTEHISDIVPTFNLGQMQPNTSAEFTILDDEPKLTVLTPKSGINKNKTITVPLLQVIDEVTKMKGCLFLSAVSLQREMYKLTKEGRESLKGKHIRISVRLYDNPEYGKDTRAYIIQEVD